MHGSRLIPVAKRTLGPSPEVGTGLLRGTGRVLGSADGGLHLDEFDPGHRGQIRLQTVISGREDHGHAYPAPRVADDLGLGDGHPVDHEDRPEGERVREKATAQGLGVHPDYGDRVV